jgi:hypothetical protein
VDDDCPRSADFVSAHVRSTAWIEVWKLGIPFRHVDGAAAFSAFAEPGWIKVAWAIRVLPRGDSGTRAEVDLLPDATDQISHWIDIRARPEAIWPWLVQMGCRRAGFYSVDLFDNGGARSAREIHPELGRLAVGQVLPATPDGDDGFEVLRVEPPRLLVLGGLFDPDAGHQLPSTTRAPTASGR